MLAETQVAVIGGGVGGLSTIYHLTKLGLTDTVLLEAAELASGTTWHAAGLCTQFSGSYNLMGLLKYSVELYQALEEETGQPVGYHKTGSLRLAESQDRLDEFSHVAGVAALLDVPFELVSPERVVELFPYAQPDGVLGAAFLPTDGWIDPTSLANRVRERRNRRGARASTGARRSRRSARTAGGWRLETPAGDVLAGTVVLAAGQWSRELARRVGAVLPVVSMPHHYVITEAVPGLRAGDDSLPVLRDPAASFYARQDNEGMVVGPFEHDVTPWAPDGIPSGFHGRLLRPELQRILPYLETAAERIPALLETPVKKTIHGPDAYTPDGRCLLGPVPGLRDFHVVCGFSIFGIVWSGGAGRYAAEWIVEGQPSDNMWEVDVSRFGDYAGPAYTGRRAVEVYRREYDIHYPEEERPGGRPLKTDPLYDRLASAAPSSAPASAGSGRSGSRSTAARPRTPTPSAAGTGTTRSARSAEPCARRSACSTRRASRSTRSPGPGAERLLDRLCANRLPAELGRMCLTQMCTPKGGIEADLTVTRLADDRFYIVSAAATETHDLRVDPGARAR